MNKGFADLCLTTWLRRRIGSIKDEGGKMKQHLLESLIAFVLHPPAFILISWSGRRDLNSRPSPWQGDALPLSYSRFLRKPNKNASFQRGGTKCTPFCTPQSNRWKSKKCTHVRVDVRIKIYASWLASKKLTKTLPVSLLSSAAVMRQKAH